MDIALYTAGDNPTPSFSVVAELEATIERLGDAPAIGRARLALWAGRVLAAARQSTDPVPPGRWRAADRATTSRGGQHHGDRTERRMTRFRYPRHGRVCLDDPTVAKARKFLRSWISRPCRISSRRCSKPDHAVQRCSPQRAIPCNGFRGAQRDHASRRRAGAEPAHATRERNVTWR